MRLIYAEKQEDYDKKWGCARGRRSQGRKGWGVIGRKKKNKAIVQTISQYVQKNVVIPNNMALFVQKNAAIFSGKLANS